jgi:HSP20 family molecular chaperone IbpA
MRQRKKEADPLVSRYEYDDSAVVVADLGVPEGETSVDVVDDTAIVVVETPEGSVEREFDVPAGAARAYINNGVVTVEVDR